MRNFSRFEFQVRYYRNKNRLLMSDAGEKRIMYWLFTLEGGNAGR